MENPIKNGWFGGVKPPPIFGNTHFQPQKRKHNLSHEKNPGWLGFIGDYTIQLYGDYNTLL